jgi:hypothetical protein
MPGGELFAEPAGSGTPAAGHARARYPRPGDRWCTPSSNSAHTRAPGVNRIETWHDPPVTCPCERHRDARAPAGPFAPRLGRGRFRSGPLAFTIVGVWAAARREAPWPMPSAVGGLRFEFPDSDHRRPGVGVPARRSSRLRRRAGDRHLVGDHRPCCARQRAPLRRWSRGRPLIAAGCPFGSCDAHTRAALVAVIAGAVCRPGVCGARACTAATHPGCKAGCWRAPPARSERGAERHLCRAWWSPLTPHPPRGRRRRRVGSRLPRPPPASARRRRPAASRAGERCVSRVSGCDTAPRATPPCRARPW